VAYEHKEAWIPAFGSILRLFCLHSVGFWFYVYERSGIESKDCGLTKLNWCFTVQEPRACKTHGKNIHLHHWIVLPNAAEYNLIFTVSRTKSIGRYSSQWVSHYIQWTTIFFHMCSVVSAPCHHVVHLSHMFHIGSIFPYVLHIYIYVLYIYVGYICIYVGYIYMVFPCVSQKQLQWFTDSIRLESSQWIFERFFTSMRPSAGGVRPNCARCTRCRGGARGSIE
jgi:hypothetical protein